MNVTECLEYIQTRLSADSNYNWWFDTEIPDPLAWRVRSYLHDEVQSFSGNGYSGLV